MKKFRRKKLAFALACASILGGKSQAMDKNKPQSRQTLAAVGGVADKKSSKGFVNWVKNHKWQLAVGGTLTAAAAVTLTILGVKYWGKKDSGGEPNKKPNINNPDVRTRILNNEIQQIEDKGNDKVETKEESIIEKNIAKIKRDSDKNIANETFELFFDKVKIILDNKDKLVASMVKKIHTFDGKKFRKLLVTDKSWYDRKKYIGTVSNRFVQQTIKWMVYDIIIEGLYKKEILEYSRLIVYKNFLILSFDNHSIAISRDRKTLGLECCLYRIKFDASDLGIGELKY